MKKINVYLTKSNRKNKKYMVSIKDKRIHFGDFRYSDYTQHKNVKRKELYITRHQKRENWDISGIYTAGFWSYHLLWSHPSLTQAINQLKKKFNINIIIS